MVPVVIALVTFVAFLPALQAEFVSWDDQANFLANSGYRGLSLPHLKWMWTSILLGHYVPLSWMTLGLDYELWGMNPAGYHLVNVLIHALNAVLLYFLARRLLRLAGVGSDTRGTLIPAAFAALFWSLHPLRVESVAWITERRDVLSLCFYLGSVLLYLRAGRWYWLAIAAFACALLSKASAMTLPLALLVLNVYPLRQLGGSAGWWSVPTRRVYRELLPFLALSAGAALLSILALQPGPQLSPSGKLAVVFYGLAFYLWKTVAPVRLSPLYEMPETVEPAAPVFLISYAAVTAVLATAWRLRRRWPALTAACAAFVVVLLPLLGVVQNGPQIAADRYTYNAAPALALLMGAAYAMLPRRRTVLAAGAAVLVLFGTLTWRQTGVWRNSETLWSRVVEIDNASALGNNNLGVVRAEQGRAGEAMELYRKAIVSRPGYPDPYNNLGYELAEQGKTADAMEHYMKAIALKADYVDALINLGNALMDQNEVGEAIEHYERAATIRPDHAGVQFNWGLALQRQGNLPEAIEHLSISVQLDPSPDAQRALAEVTRELEEKMSVGPLQGPPPR